MVSVRSFRSFALVPLTLRGFLVLGVSAYLVLGPGLNSADLVAATLGGGALCVMFLLLCLNLLWGRVLKRSMQLSLVAPGDKLHSQSPLLFVLRSAPISIPPLYLLMLRAHFEHTGCDPLELRLSGFRREGRTELLTLTFPHRGNWKLEYVECRFGDIFGLCEFRWQSTLRDGKLSVTVHPRSTEERALPVFSSTQRSGEMLSSKEYRSGDPLDLKQYHPADGMRRIVWKLFAKSGELYSRHPEPAMTPEGTVLLFTLARREDDHVCATVLQYMRKLEELDLTVLLSCESVKQAGVAVNVPQAENLLIDSVWDANASTPESIRAQMGELFARAAELAPLGKIDKLLLFAAKERFRSGASTAALSAIGNYLETLQISPVFFICSADGVLSIPTHSEPSTRAISSVARNFFVQGHSGDKSAVQLHSAQFLRICAQSQWEVIL